MMRRPGAACCPAGQARFGWGYWLVLLLLVPFVCAFAFCVPTGDDFDSATRAMFLFDVPGGFYEIGRAWLNWSGRYTFHFLAVFLGKAVEMRLAYALVCAAVPFLAGLAIFGLARLAAPGLVRRDAVYLGGLAGLTLLACHQHVSTFYMQTDALTMGLQVALTLCFCCLVCGLWQAHCGAAASGPQLLALWPQAFTNTLPWPSISLPLRPSVWPAAPVGWRTDKSCCPLPGIAHGSSSGSGWSVLRLCCFPFLRPAIFIA
ncbi:MAG: hypothetical protein Q4F27_06570 [Desulfovibrionaceae bacterium]|nr:hypothetical protein [Desulfovibrionaceae bacterium]